MSQEKLEFPIVENGEIDLIAVALTIWVKRWTIFKTIGLFFILGILIAVFSNNEYTAIVKLMPESSKTPSLGALGGFAAQFGVGGLSGSLEEDNIPSNNYSDIVESVPFILELMKHEFLMSDASGNKSLFQYYSELKKTSLLSNIKMYTIGLPYIIIEKLKKENATSAKDSSISRLSKEEWIVYNKLVENISVSIDKKTNVVVLKVTMPEDHLAAKVADQITRMLVEYVKDYKTEKIRNDLDFIEIQLKESEERFEKAQESLALYLDFNQGSKTKIEQTNVERLTNDYELTFTIYSALAQKFSETRIKLQEQIPVVKVLEPASVPEKKSAPRRSLIVLVSILLGGVVGLGIIYLEMILKNFRSRLKELVTQNKLIV